MSHADESNYIAPRSSQIIITTQHEKTKKTTNVSWRSFEWCLCLEGGLCLCRVHECLQLGRKLPIGRHSRVELQHAILMNLIINPSRNSGSASCLKS